MLHCNILLEQHRAKNEALPEISQSFYSINNIVNDAVCSLQTPYILEFQRVLSHALHAADEKVLTEFILFSGMTCLYERKGCKDTCGNSY